MSIMTYDNQNKKEDLSCYLNDDDSSAEEELLLVAEKLETMQHQEEEARKKVTLPIENDVDHSSHSPTFIRHSCPESTSFDWAPDSSSTIPAPMETNMSREIAAKDVVAIDATDSYIRFEIRNEKSANENSNIPSQNEASIREDEFDKNIDEVQVVQRQESKHPQSPQYRENEKTTPSQLQKQQIIATAKTTIDESEGKNHQTKDKKSLHDDKGNWNNKHSIDGYKSTLAKKVDLVKYVAEHEEQKEVIVDLTKMGSTNSSRDYLDSSDHSTRDRSEMTNLSDCCTSFSSSSSSLSDDSAEAAKLPSNKKSVDIHTYIHRSDLLLQFKSHLDSVPATTTTATRDTSTHVLNNSSATPYDSGITACANGAKGTKQLKVIGRSNGTSSGVAPDDIKDCTTGRPSPGELWRATAVVRNPYLRKSDAIIASVNEAEPILTHDRKNQRPFPIVNKSKKATDVHTNDIDNGNKAQTFRPESSDKKMISTPTTNPTEMRRGDMIIVDKQELGEELESEVSRSLYAPPVYHEGRPPPILHRFDCCNHPLHSRQTIPVGSLDRLFTPTIVNSLWAKKFDRFNHFQSAMLDSLSDSDNNVVVSAPTGAGKSTIFEMAMARFLAADLRAQEQQGKTSNSTPSSLASKARKMVYIAPSKALCEERYADWSRRLQKMNLGLEVALITGQELGSEQETKAFPDLISAHLIVTTPEKWDSMTRRWNENFFLFASIKLLLLDEVHLLGDESRGWCLESIVTRMKTIQRAASALITTPLEISTSSYAETNPDAIRSCFRTVAVSATLPNISEVADFLQANEAYIFDDSYRPVPLTKHVNALGRVGNNEWRFWSNLSEYVPEIIKRFSHGKQSLIFCHSKKETQKVTELLIRRNFGNRGVRIVDPPWNKPVEYMLGHGIGFHHAGMSKDERKTIEEAFLNKKIKCLAATSTLAVGVNLPAHLVIIVGTKAWRNNEKGKGYQEIEVSALLQMVGRAGRPGLDSTGVAVVLTDNSSKKRIENLLEAGTGPAKSNLVPRLPEVLNTEISQRVITNMEEALRWLQTTFLFSCLKHNKNAIISTQKLRNNAVKHLRDIGVVETSELHSIRPLVASLIMNRNLVSFEEMKSITALSFDTSQCQILRSMSKLKSLQSFVKRNEKRELKEFHKSDLMKYKLPGLLSKFIVKDPSEKAFILLQSNISRHKYKNEMLNDEQITVRDDAIKFLEVAQEYCVKASKHGNVALECYRLQRSLNYSLWGESSGVFNQFEWIGSSKTASNVLTFDGIRSFQDVLDFSEQKLDEIFAKTQIQNLPKNAGRIVKHTARDLCRRRLILSTDVEYTKNSNIPTDLICSLKYHDPVATMTREEGEQDLKFSLIAYTDNSRDSSLIFEENISSPSSFRVMLPSSSFQKLSVHLVGTWVGFDQVKIIDAMDTFVSSNERSVRLFQNPRAINFEIDTLASAKIKKRKSRQTEISHCTNQRQSAERYCTAENQVKKPSPITPQPKDRYSGIPHPFMTFDQESLREFWEESKEACETIQSATLPLTPGRSIPFIQPQAEKTSVSINVTPTMRLPMKKTLRHMRSSSSMPSNFVDQKLGPAITKHGNSGISGLEKCCGQNAIGQDRLPIGEVYPFAMHESSAVATLAKEIGETQKHSWNEPKSQSDQRTENGMMARRATKTSDQTVDCSPLTTSRQGNLEKIVWNQSRTKQQRSQKRAFTEKKMNPFRTFSHDPNDFERHLEQLSQQSSIIPNPLLAKMKQSSIVSNRKCRHHFSTDRNHRARTARHRYSNKSPRQVLREKAFEQQYQHEKIMSHQENIPRHVPSQYPHQKNCYTPQSLLPVNTWQDNVDAFRNSCGRSGCQLPYPQNVERQFRFPDSPASSGALHFQDPEKSPGRYPTTLSSHYQPFDRMLSRSSSTFQSPREPQVRTFEEDCQHLHTDSFGSSRVKVDTQSQHQRLHGREPPHHQVSNSPVDFQSDFHDVFY